MQNASAAGARKRKHPAGDDAARGAEQPRYPINSVDNALKLLLMFRDTRLIRVADASESLGVVRSTAHRLLAMLQYRGLVLQDPETKAYAPGPALLDIGLSAVRQFDIRQYLRPYLERLAAEVGETVHLTILEGANSLFLDSVEGPRALRTSSRVGRSYPAHTTSGGKVLLAQLSPAQLAELYPTDTLSGGLTSGSLATRKQLLRELQLVRERGYGTNRGESEPEIAAVAVLVRNAFGQVRAAIAVSAPLSRLDEGKVPSVAAAITRIVEEAAPHLA